MIPWKDKKYKRDFWASFFKIVFFFFLLGWRLWEGASPTRNKNDGIENQNNNKNQTTKSNQKPAFTSRSLSLSFSLLVIVLVSHLSIVVAFHNSLTDRSRTFCISSSLHFPSTSKHLSRQTFFQFFYCYIRWNSTLSFFLTILFNFFFF